MKRSVLLTQTEIGATAMSRYLHGKAIPKPEALVQIIDVLPPEHACHVLISYLRELFPERVSRMLCVSDRDLAESPVTPFETQCPQEIEIALATLREMAIQRGEVADLLLHFCRALNR